MVWKIQLRRTRRFHYLQTPIIQTSTGSHWAKLEELKSLSLSILNCNGVLSEPIFWPSISQVGTFSPSLDHREGEMSDESGSEQLMVLTPSNELESFDSSWRRKGNRRKNKKLWWVGCWYVSEDKILCRSQAHTLIRNCICKPLSSSQPEHSTRQFWAVEYLA